MLKLFCLNPIGAILLFITSTAVGQNCGFFSVKKLIIVNFLDLISADW